MSHFGGFGGFGGAGFGGFGGSGFGQPAAGAVPNDRKESKPNPFAADTRRQFHFIHIEFYLTIKNFSVLPVIKYSADT